MATFPIILKAHSLLFTSKKAFDNQAPKDMAPKASTSILRQLLKDYDGVVRFENTEPTSTHAGIDNDNSPNPSNDLPIWLRDSIFRQNETNRETRDILQHLAEVRVHLFRNQQYTFQTGDTGPLQALDEKMFLATSNYAPEQTYGTAMSAALCSTDSRSSARSAYDQQGSPHLTRAVSAVPAQSTASNNDTTSLPDALEPIALPAPMLQSPGEPSQQQGVDPEAIKVGFKAIREAFYAYIQRCMAQYNTMVDLEHQVEELQKKLPRFEQQIAPQADSSKAETTISRSPSFSDFEVVDLRDWDPDSTCDTEVGSKHA